jgi:hypothetical protein
VQMTASFFPSVSGVQAAVACGAMRGQAGLSSSAATGLPGRHHTPGHRALWPAAGKLPRVRFSRWPGGDMATFPSPAGCSWPPAAAEGLLRPGHLNLPADRRDGGQAATAASYYHWASWRPVARGRQDGMNGAASGRVLTNEAWRPDGLLLPGVRAPVQHGAVQRQTQDIRTSGPWQWPGKGACWTCGVNRLLPILMP